jgi:hypothetical protein
VLHTSPKYLLRIIVLVTLIVSILSIRPCQALVYDFSDTITDVVDGDSFKGNSGKEYRLADVNAPEWNQPGGPASTSNLESLILHKNVYIDIDGTMTHGRYVCVVYIDYDSTRYLNVNKAQWSGGYAQVDDHPNAWNPYGWTLYVEKPPPPPPKTYTLTVQTPDGSGSTNPSVGTYSFNAGESQQITATPSSGWSFNHWVQDGSTAGTSMTLTVTMNAAHTVKAVFTQGTTPPPPPTPRASEKTHDFSHKRHQRRAVHHYSEKDKSIFSDALSVPY